MDAVIANLSARRDGVGSLHRLYPGVYAVVDSANRKDRTDGDALDRHLNIFLPYDRAPQHEDQLTRAAMIVIARSR